MQTDLTEMVQDAEYAGLPRAQRERCHDALVCLETLPAGCRKTGPGGIFSRLARALACSEKRATSLYYAYRERQDWRVFVDGRTTARAKLELEGANSAVFKAWVMQRFEANQRSMERTISEIRRIFRHNTVTIPGFEKRTPGEIPPGCSATSLRNKINRAELDNIRLGLSKNAAAQVPVLTTRANLEPGQVIEFDDVWHDNLVVVEGQIVRVLEFGAVDVASGCRVHWGHLPALRGLKEDNPKTRAGLTQAHFILFLAYFLRYVGYHKDGVRLVMEHGTATLPERVRVLLEGSIPNLTIVMGGMHDNEQRLLNGYAGSRHGNPRTKTHIESQHNAIHNFLGHLPAQVGKDRQHHPESTYGMIKAQEQVELWRARLVEAGRSDLAGALQDHFLTMHHFSEILLTAYTLFNRRTDHSLEGWEKNTQLEYQVSPGVWMSTRQLTNNGANPLSPLIAAAARENPGLVREVKLSPAEVWERGKGNLERIPLTVYMDLLSMVGEGEKSFVRTPTVHGVHIVLQNKLVSPAPLYYRAECITPLGRRIQLGEGEKVHVVLNPYAPEALVLLDERGGILGECPQAVRADLGNMEAIYEEVGRTHAENVARQTGQRARWQGERTRVESIHAANRAVLEEAGIRLRGTGQAGAATPRLRASETPALRADVVADAMAATDIDVFGNLS